MVGSVPAHRLAAAALLLLLLLLSPGTEPRPHTAHERQLQLEAIKRGILERLDLREPPKVRQPLSPGEALSLQHRYEEALAEMRRNQSRGETGPASRAIRLLTPKLELNSEASGSNDEGREEPGQGRLGLQLSRSAVEAGLPLEPQVTHAELRLFPRGFLSVELGRFLSKRQSHIQAYQLPEPGAISKGPSSIRLLDSGSLEAAILTLDLTPMLQQWLQRSSEPLLRLQLVGPREVMAALASPGAELPVLEVQFQELRGKGNRRARALGQDCEHQGGKCCPRTHRVSFQELGWADWVLAPKDYMMKFCQGSCPHNYKPASMHSQIKARMHNLAPGTMPEPCCVPASYEPLVLMHYNSEGKITLSPFEDMIAKDCHCA
ncbi:growth/differentiation factor 15 [Tachyglossus aculeatus]|uniref:growth/differentiation factor 15 n=1 Tax=Tachyglossus aculeatus TaxID=9261 RepID=UPI0018F43CDC|nr:growth/differentiation factor 15 [Tachyglossus aculeatus]